MKEENGFLKVTSIRDRLNKEHLVDVKTSEGVEETNTLIRVKLNTLRIHINCARGVNPYGNTRILEE